jgi:citrate synthase/citryl-CoA lyase
MIQSTTEEWGWKTQIGVYQKDNIIIAGYSIADLIENVDFASAIYLVLKGDLPEESESKMINALLVSTVDHGLSPSEVVSRYIAAAGSPVQAAIAGGILMFADYHGGAMQALAKELQEEMWEIKKAGQDIEKRAAAIVAEHRQKKSSLSGFGHPDHPEGDPRAKVLFKRANDLGVAGDYTRLMLSLEKELEKSVGRKIAINIDGAFAAILSDLGFDWRVARGFIIISRAAGLLAHYYEEIDKERPWRRGPRFTYTGIAPRKIKKR